MNSILPFLFDLLAYTAVFVIIVLGLGVIASMMGIFNFAHGEFLLLGAYSVFFLDRAGVPPWIGMVCAPFIVGVVGLFLERFAIRRFYATPVVAMLGTYAIGLVIREAVRTALGGQFYTVVAPLDGPILFGDLAISKWRSVVIVVTLLVLLGCWLLFKKTNFGLKVRAALENPMLARASGIPVNRVYSITFAFGAALAGLAGAADGAAVSAECRHGRDLSDQSIFGRHAGWRQWFARISCWIDPGGVNKCCLTLGHQARGGRCDGVCHCHYGSEIPARWPSF
jgi:branched-chain amino acid transport system permease protein